MLSSRRDARREQVMCKCNDTIFGPATDAILEAFILVYTFFEEFKQMSPADCELRAVICYPSENSVTVYGCLWDISYGDSKLYLLNTVGSKMIKI